MKVNFSSAAACLLVFVLASTSSCKKIIDEIVKHPNGAASDCRIVQVTSHLKDSDMLDTARFSYDGKGNPVSIKHSVSAWLLENRYYSADQHFGYYPDGRLAAYLMESYPYVDASGKQSYFAYTWQKFTYVGSNLIIDSVFSYASGALEGSFSPINPQDNLKGIQNLILDSYGRVSKIDVYDTEGNFERTVNYPYDSNGNLVVPGVTYNTTKHNLKQTSKVWMLITYDFSLNSPVNEVETYNNKKLPEKVSLMPWFIFSTNGGTNADGFDNIRFSYQCK